MPTLRKAPGSGFDRRAGTSAAGSSPAPSGSSWTPGSITPQDALRAKLSALVQKAALEVQDYAQAVSWAAQTALRDIIGRTTLTDLLRGRERIEAELQQLIDQRSNPWGVTVSSVEMRDVVIPGALQDAMSREAQAAREKQALYRRCFDLLAPGGVFANGDEIRDADDVHYRGALTKWAAHMQDLADAGRVSAPMAETLLGWRKRNVERFDAPRVSGDDCHETIDVQLGYLRDAGFEQVRATWQKQMWAVMVGGKS